MYEGGERPIGTTMVDPEPDLAGLLEALAAGWLPGENESEPLEPWQFTDKALLRELELGQRRIAGAQAHWLALLAEAEQREATLRVSALPTSSWL